MRSHRFLFTALTLGGFIVLIFIHSSLQAINTSPSKPQGGSTNNIPYKNSSDSPSLLSNPVRWIFGPPRSEAMNRVNAPPHFKVELLTNPKNFTPTTNGVLKARMVLINQSKEKYILEFKSAQRFEFVITDKTQKTEYYRASQNKVYSQQLSSTVINRNEKLVYEEEIFSPSNQIANLPPGEYKLIGQVTAQTPISVETTFQVSR